MLCCAVQACIKEVLRLYPAIPVFPREAAADDVLASGHPVSKGGSVASSHLWMYSEEMLAVPASLLHTSAAACLVQRLGFDTSATLTMLLFLLPRV